MSRDISNGALGPFPIYWPDVKPAVREAQELLTKFCGVPWVIDGHSVVYQKGAGRISIWLQLSSIGRGSWEVEGIVDDWKVCSISGPREQDRWARSRGQGHTPQSDITDAVQECWQKMGDAFDRDPAPKEEGGEWRLFKISSASNDSATALLQGGSWMNIHGLYMNNLVGQGWVRLRVALETEVDSIYQYRVLEILHPGEVL